MVFQGTKRSKSCRIYEYFNEERTEINREKLDSDNIVHPKETIKKYKALNSLAEKYGTVILGTNEDKDIPLCELKQAFGLENNIYNRSAAALTLETASDFYSEVIASLEPERIIIHLGENDTELFITNQYAFRENYKKLITLIRNENKNCEIILISLKNYDDDETINEMNKTIKYIAESERTAFEDISQRKVWNPKGTKDVISFIYNIGFDRPLKIKKPIYDLVKILFCFSLRA